MNIIQEKLNEALKYHQTGNIEKACELYQQILSKNPNNHIALYFLGIILYESGHSDSAVNYIEKAVSLTQNPDYLEDLASIYYEKKYFNKSVEAFKKLAELCPKDGNVWNNLGLLYWELQNVDEAVKCMKRGLEFKPDDTGVYFYLGLALSMQANYKEAIPNFQKALEANPDDIESCYNLGLALNKENQIEESIPYFERTIQLDPNNYRAYLNLGMAMYRKDDYDSAIELYHKAIELNPVYPEAFINLGIAFNAKKEYDKAFELFNKALEFNPQNAEAYLNIGNIFKDKNDFEEAIKYYNMAVELDPNYSEAYTNLGAAYTNTADLEKAIYYCKKAVEIKPDCPEARFNLGIACLTIKDFENGWENYEWRLKLDNDNVKIPKFPQPKWNGSPLKDKTIYVYREQGFGDTIQFVRYLPLLAEMGAKVLFKPDSGLENLLIESNLEAEILDPNIPDESVKFDEHTPLLSLPYIFKTNLDNIPYSEGYLKANKEKIQKYKEKYFNTSCFKVGINWQGNPKHKNDLNRSVPLRYFYDLARFDNVKLYSLQKGYGVEQLNNLPDDVEIINLGESFNDFSDTAAAIENLDLTVSVDTSVAHLASALGKQTWIIMQRTPEWRWFLDSEDSPWYKNAKLFRPKQIDSWDEVMNRLTNAFKTLYRH